MFKRCNLTCLYGLLVFANMTGTVLAEWTYQPDSGWVESSTGEIKSAEDFLSWGDRLAEEKQFAEAIALFQRVYDRDPNQGRKETALFGLGNAQMHAGKLKDSVDTFQTWLSRYAVSARRSDAVRGQLEALRLMMDPLYRKEVFGYKGSGSTKRAIRTLRATLERYPYESFSAEYQTHLANFLFRRGRFLDALLEYRYIIQTWPDSASTPLARFQVAECHYQVWLERKVNREHLLNARKRFVRFTELYGDVLPDLALAARARLKVIDEDSAAHLLDSAKTYRRLGRKTSERFYLRILIRDYPETEKAKRARARLGDLEEEIGGDDRVVGEADSQ